MYMLCVWWWFVATFVQHQRCVLPFLFLSSLFPSPPPPLRLPSASPPPPRYLIKGWLQTGRKDARLWRMYNAAVDGMVRWLLHHNPADKLLYLANLQWRGGREGVREGGGNRGNRRSRYGYMVYLQARGGMYVYVYCENVHTIFSLTSLSLLYGYIFRCLTMLWSTSRVSCRGGWRSALSTKRTRSDRSSI